MAILEPMNPGDFENDPNADNLFEFATAVAANINQVNDALPTALSLAGDDLMVKNGKLAVNFAGRFAIVYPNGGTEASPAAIVNNQRYIVANPFPNKAVHCQLQAFMDGVWGDVHNGTSIGTVSGATVVIGSVYGALGNNIVVQTAFNYVMGSAPYQGNVFGSTTLRTSMTVRIIVTCKD